MKGIYLTECDASDKNSGVSKKISYQLEAFEKFGFEMTLVDKRSVNNYKRSRLLLILYNILGINSRLVFKQLKILKKILNHCDYNFIYIRQILFDEYLIKTLKKIKIAYPQLKIIFEIPTYPYDLEMHPSQKIMLFNDKLARKKLYGAIDRIVTYSKDKLIFNIPCLVIPNGILYDSIKLRNPENHDGINFLAVALFDKWHGYDRFINGMGIQYDIVKEKNIHLHLVGGGKSIGLYKELVKIYNLNDYVHFYGELHGNELDMLYNISDIALDSMGRHRVNVFYNSTLKGKEYCAHGIPMVSGVETELDEYTDFDFYLRIPANDNIIDMKQMVDYYSRLYQKYDALELASIIRNKTKKLFDFEMAYKPVVNYAGGK